MDKVSKKKTVKKTIKKTSEKKNSDEVVLSVKKKKVAKKVPIKSALKTKTLTKKITRSKSKASDKKSLKNTEEVTLVTGSLSLRLAEKKAIYEAWFQKKSPRIASPLSHVFGYVFIIVGIFSLYINTLSLKGELASPSSFLSSVTCSDPAGCNVSPSNIVENVVAEAQPSPIVLFLTYPVVVTGENTTLTVQVNNASEHKLSIFSPQTGQSKTLVTPGASSDNKYVYDVPTASLLPGDYVVRVTAWSVDRSKRADFSGPVFVVPKIVTPEPVKVEASEAEVIKNETNTDLLKEPVITETTETVRPTEVVATSSTPIIRAPVKPVATTTPKVTDVFSLNLISAEQANQYRLHIRPTFEYESVEVYAQPEQAKSALFLGVASRSSDGWYYWLDGKGLPNGNYRIIAKGVSNGQIKDSAEIRFVNNSHALAQKPENQTLIKELIQSSATNTTDLVALKKNPVTSDDFAKMTLRETQVATSSDNVRLVQNLMSEKASQFDKLFKNFAAAKATGDESIIRLSETEIEAEVQALIKHSMAKNSEYSYSELEQGINVEVTRMKEKVTLFDKIVRERTAEESGRDTDRDGISDFDEVIIYKTDPTNPDTDGDSFSDGVEIATGYNPNDPSSEALLTFASPKDVSYVNEELLSVKSITPLLNFEADSVKPKVYSEISGQAIPNSFVTLYIFSTPTVVMVKTDDTGNFSYIFTKELEDGEHEIYVAMTDNTGDIVVRSNPLRFVKTAEAFSYVSDTSETPIVTAEVSKSSEFRLLNIVATMGIISFGLILLLLGKSIKAKREEDEVLVNV